MNAAHPTAETISLTKAYGKVAALDDCTLQVEGGTVFGLLGPNGAGKTTLLRLLMGFMRPTRGRATIAGRDCYRDSALVHKHVSYLPGDVRLFRGMTGRDVLSLFARLRGQSDSLASTQLAARMNLDLSGKVAQLSTGMRQKLAIAAVMAVDAPLLILDEPTSNLDPTVRNTVQSLIQEARSSGRTVILSSHVLSEVEQVCDRVVILRRGQVVHDQLMCEIRRRHRIRARLTGPLTPTPDHLAGEIVVSQRVGGELTIDAPGDLAPLLGWLATLPLAEIHIEPVGLGAVYEQYHPAEDVALRKDSA